MSPRTAAVCKNGHIVSMDVIDPVGRVTQAESIYSIGGTGINREPAIPLSAYCGKCGLGVMTACVACSAPIENHNYLAGDRAPLAFCTGCGAPHPWATREERIARLIGLLDSEESLTESERLEAVEAIAVLSEPEDEGEPTEDRVRAGERLRRIAPKMWSAASPVFTALFTAELKARLGLPPG